MPEVAKRVKRPLVGRPAKLNEDTLARAKTYLQWCTDNPIVTGTDFDVNGNVVGVKTFPRLPNLAGLAFYLGVGRGTLNTWITELSDEALSKEFSKIFEAVKVAGEKMLIEFGFSGKSNPLMSKFLLSAVYGYREKLEADYTTAGEPFKISLLTYGGNDPK